MFKTNLFSNNSYKTIDDVMVDQQGRTFFKSGDNWVANNGDFIQKINNDFLNQRTGVMSTFGDPFGDNNG
jgi:hypothetical protein